MGDSGEERERVGDSGEEGREWGIVGDIEGIEICGFELYLYQGEIIKERVDIIIDGAIKEIQNAHLCVMLGLTLIQTKQV